jgi:hypothetical protein
VGYLVEHKTPRQRVAGDAATYRGPQTNAAGCSATRLSGHYRRDRRGPARSALDAHKTAVKARSDHLAQSRSKLLILVGDHVRDYGSYVSEDSIMKLGLPRSQMFGQLDANNAERVPTTQRPPLDIMDARTATGCPRDHLKRASNILWLGVYTWQGSEKIRSTEV